MVAALALVLSLGNHSTCPPTKAGGGAGADGGVSGGMVFNNFPWRNGNCQASVKWRDLLSPHNTANAVTPADVSLRLVSPLFLFIQLNSTHSGRVTERSQRSASQDYHFQLLTNCQLIRFRILITRIIAFAVTNSAFIRSTGGGSVAH